MKKQKLDLHINIDTYLHSCKNIHMCMYTCICICTHIYTYIYNTHKHMYICNRTVQYPWVCVHASLPLSLALSLALLRKHFIFPSRPLSWPVSLLSLSLSLSLSLPVSVRSPSHPLSLTPGLSRSRSHALFSLSHPQLLYLSHFRSLKQTRAV